MSAQPAPSTTTPPLKLRNPILAALLAWLVPGAGHLYQGRTAKGLLFMSCILGLFFYGLYLGQGKVVYADDKVLQIMNQPPNVRWAYVCQLGIGLPALPAFVQELRAEQGRQPLTHFMAPPAERQAWDRQRQQAQHEEEPGSPRLKQFESPDELAAWNKDIHRYFELGTVYTMIAGLLNVLAIYDALAGPVPNDDDDEAKPDSK